MSNPIGLHQKRIYESVISYETSLIYGTLSRLIFQADQISTEEKKLISTLFDKLRASHIRTERLRPIAKAIKTCLHTNQDVCYANLIKSKDFGLVIKDEDSFLVIVSNQIIPTIEDIKLFLHIISSDAPQESSILDIALSSTDVGEIFTGLSDVVESISLLKQEVEEQDDNRFLTGKEIIDVYDAYIKRLEEGMAFYPTGFEAVDRHLVEGFAPGQVTIIAGRTSMGKSAYVTNIMKNLFLRHIHTAQYVLEMDNISFTHRLVSNISSIELDKITKYRSHLTESERSTLETVRQMIIDNPYLHLNDKPSPSIDQMKLSIAKLQKRIGQPYLVIVIDLFDKIKNVMMSSNNMQANFHMALSQIQIAAKELGVHFILVAQINRDNEKKTDKRPALVNLKHSGAFEEVADIILFIDRPAYRMLEEDFGDLENENTAPVFGTDNDFQTFDSFSKSQLEHNAFFENPDSVTQESLGQDPKFNKEKKITEALKQKKLIKAGGLVVPIEQYAEVIIAKQRRGPANKVIPFIFHGATSTFTSVKLISPVVG